MFGIGLDPVSMADGSTPTNTPVTPVPFFERTSVLEPILLFGIPALILFLIFNSGGRR